MKSDMLKAYGKTDVGNGDRGTFFHICTGYQQASVDSERGRFGTLPPGKQIYGV